SATDGGRSSGLGRRSAGAAGGEMAPDAWLALAEPGAWLVPSPVARVPAPLPVARASAAPPSSPASGEGGRVRGEICEVKSALALAHKYSAIAQPAQLIMAPCSWAFRAAPGRRL